jgi:hypothetical protein
MVCPFVGGRETTNGANRLQRCLAIREASAVLGRETAHNGKSLWSGDNKGTNRLQRGLAAS